MKIAISENIIDAWSVLRDFCLDCGFEHAVFGTNRLHGIEKLGAAENSYVLSDLSGPIVDALWRQTGFGTTSAAQWAEQSTGPVSPIDPATKNPAEPLYFQEADAGPISTGVTSGYLVALHKSNTRARSLFGVFNFGGLQSEADAIWQDHGAQIEALATIFNLKAGSLPLPIKKRKLTTRQIEVLSWMGAGKTMQETATILGISPATVEKHLRQARDTLGVSTTTQAVLLAQINGQIFSNIG